MSNLMKFEFAALDTTDAKDLGNTIMKENEASKLDKAKAMIFLRHNLDEGLKTGYLTIKDPLELWNNLKERYYHQKMMISPKTCYDLMHLRLKDFKSISEYNFALFKIDSEKNYEEGFKKYLELISCLLVAEQNNELLIKNHEIRPTESTPFPKVNATIHNNFEKYENHGCGHSHGHECGRRRNNYHSHGGHSPPFQ
ncbi:hypothetical protein CDL12_27260 [Handroanthus impetiginosus]|uniref:Uncharacterized protein n=1 Tax=Handroanthus impetiginosus TaxID=429701 RepID=A0A2G9G4J9_9LAMI|nr:hypothetical protein CDL12_27260 [Handroanthus impetiginosus]